MSSTKPTILLIPGSFCGRALYATMIEQLSAAGYEVIFVHLPSIGPPRNGPPATMADDANYIRSVTTTLIDEGKTVVLAAHSYGGIPMTESVKGLSTAEQQAQGHSGGISRLIYFTAIVCEIGWSLKSTLEGITKIDNTIVDGDYMHLDPELNAKLCFNDLPFEEGLAWTAKKTNHSSVSFTGELTYPGYKYIPVTYLICEEDKILPPELQKSWVERVEKASGSKVDVYYCSSGHCPNVSLPETVVRVIRKAVGEDI